MGLPMEADEEEIMEKMDADGSGTLERIEWVEVCAPFRCAELLFLSFPLAPSPPSPPAVCHVVVAGPSVKIPKPR